MAVETVTQQISSAYWQLRRAHADLLEACERYYAEARANYEDSWYNMETIWQNTRESWSGVNTNYFASQFWAQFGRGIKDYLRTLQALDEAISNSRAEINE